MRNFVLYLLLLALVAVIGFAASPYVGKFLFNLGVIREEVPISGTGSMYPTFPKSEGVSEQEASNQTVAQPEMRRFPGGLNILGQSLFIYKLQRGDIIEFESDLTRKITKEKYGTDTGFVKRVIALPGDEIELRDGFVKVNTKIPDEPYTAKPRSTYGGDSIPDCQVKKVPVDSVFVLGDNRKASLDSRFEIGFVKLSDIHHVLPLNEQDPFKKNWRDTKFDQEFAHTSTTDPQDFVNLLNQVRVEKNKTKLKLNDNLIKSSKFRGDIILDTDDFSIEATRSGLTLEKAVRQAGYRNIVFAELFTRGYYDSDELLENMFEFPQTSNLLLSDEYQDIGLSAVLADVNNCPTQVIVIHLGGFKPPNYQKVDIESWKLLIDNLVEILPSWESLKNAESIDRDKLDALISLLKTRLNNAQKIYSRLSRNEWLTDEENALVKNDNNLHTQAEQLISELNK
ncbi:signal peptidase I [Candidatus Gottesmanbacteria bacterium RBG_16_37_8]|uniref:Signal peptidase I n=1 Tax=Candidatus Gottesmanbacteria bacterium RBG_16_37_8 TaxID=1798371 RepID=A0A1F5YQK1_9BACT|nr:MAG: signal peptidase I [Candidatus Gottesmanbacteria bacterium RBG_16_37_8]